MPSKLPTLRTYEVADPERPQWVGWCPWCEDMHRHGVGSGSRSAHCWNKSSPYKLTGYQLRKVGVVANENQVIPRHKAFGRRKTLAQGLEGEAKALRSAFLRAVLGVSASKSRLFCFTHDLADGERLVVINCRWWIESEQGGKIEGNSLLDLASLLHGIPAGVIAVRWFEAMLTQQLDADTALAMQDTVDAWAARGSPDREGRS